MSSTLMSNRPAVLVVEPDGITRGLLLNALQRAGFEPVGASSGEGALLLLREGRAAIDWLVTHRSLPGLVDGPVLVDEFRTYHSLRPVLVAGSQGMSRTGGSIVALESLLPDSVVTHLRSLTRELLGTAETEAQALAA